jgi:hypothetical protein
MKRKENAYGDVSLVIAAKEIRPEWLKKIKEYGLYCLEELYGDAPGHGQGVGGEDIHFVTKKTRLNFSINWNGRCLDIYEEEDLYTYNRKYYDTVVVDPSDKLIKFLKRRLLKKSAK